MTGDPSSRSPRAPGLQPERTRLAWQRSGLATGTSALVLVRLAVTRDAPMMVAAGAAVLAVLAVAVLVEGSLERPGRRRRRVEQEDGTPRGLPLVATGALGATLALAVVGLALVVTT